MKYLIENAQIVNEGEIFTGHVLVDEDKIKSISEQKISVNEEVLIIDAAGKYLLPGVIDDQVHFRDPGLTHKGSIRTESRAAVAGGVTSFMDMPNTIPQALTREILEQKYLKAQKDSIANYSFFMGASNDNLDEVLKTDPENVCGVKVFLGASTGNMLVDDPDTLDEIFSKCKMLIAVHSEDETIIQQNTAIYKEKYGDDVPVSCHPDIRSAEACYSSTEKAVNLALKNNTRLHVLHLSTEKEMSLFSNLIPLSQKQITAEVCVHHLWFCDEDYEKYGTKIKWNPAIKKRSDRDALFAALCNGKIDIVATDHAPHTLEEKDNSYFKAPSGGPLVQHSLVAMCELAKEHGLPLTFIAEKMCHAPAQCFGVEKRGYIKEGYFADLVLLDTNASQTINSKNILYKCGWSPFEGTTFSSQVTHTFVNGNLVWCEGCIIEGSNGKRLTFKK